MINNQEIVKKAPNMILKIRSAFISWDDDSSLMYRSWIVVRKMAVHCEYTKTTELKENSRECLLDTLTTLWSFGLYSIIL
jgi:hypothetical protein